MIRFFYGERSGRRGEQISRRRMAWGFAYRASAMLLFIMAGAVAVAQDAVPDTMRLTPSMAVELAIANNLSLESTRIANETKKRKSDYSWNQFIPSVTVGGSLILDNKATTQSGTTLVPAGIFQSGTYTSIPNLPPELQDSPVFGVAAVPYSVTLPQWHIATSIQISLNLSIAMIESMNRLRLDYESGLLSYDKAVSQLERDVRKSYYQMLLVQENIKLQRESLVTAERQEATARANYQAGLAPELSLLQAQVSKENLRPTIEEAENNFKLLMAQFAMNLGLPYDTSFEFEPLATDISFVPLDVRELISQASNSKPDIQEIRQNILLLQSARKAQVQSMYPALSISWGLTNAFTQDPWKDNWFNGDNWNQSGSLTISLGIQLHNLLPWTSSRQTVKDIDDNMQSLNIGLAQAIRGTELEIYNTVLSLQKAQTQIAALQKTVELAQRSYELTEQAYRAGFQDLLQVQNAEQQLNQAKVGVLVQNFTYLQGLLDLEYAIGVPFGTLSGSIQ
ncbi:MAG: TolC family protein [Treponema sp.]|nr:TolC family protein [Treponema sp.]